MSGIRRPELKEPLLPKAHPLKDQLTNGVEIYHSLLLSTQNKPSGALSFASIYPGGKKDQSANLLAELKKCRNDEQALSIAEKIFKSDNAALKLIVSLTIIDPSENNLIFKNMGELKTEAKSKVAGQLIDVAVKGLDLKLSKTSTPSREIKK